MEQNRGNWYLLTGLVLGLVLGLVYAWAISPVSQVDTHPHLLRNDYKDIYRELISRAYQANNNLPRAQARLELVGDEDPALALAAQAQRFLAESGDNEMALILANLSSALQIANKPLATAVPPTSTAGADGADSPAGNDPNNGASAGDPTASPPGGTSIPPTPSPTDAPPFILQDSIPICDPTLGEPLIQVIATDGAGAGIPGITLQISLGTDPKQVFYTGLKPELGLGYADFEAEPGLTYELEVPESGLVITGIEVPACQTNQDESYWGSWEIYITHPN